jgi:hypothetical protein
LFHPAPLFITLFHPAPLFITLFHPTPLSSRAHGWLAPTPTAGLAPPQITARRLRHHLTIDVPTPDAPTAVAPADRGACWRPWRTPRAPRSPSPSPAAAMTTSR